MLLPGVRLGIDFGTSHTVAVLRWPDGRVRPLLFDGSPRLPSAVYYDPARGLIVGRDAVRSARLAPANYEANPKRSIDDSELLLGDRAFPVRTVIAAVLSRLQAEASRAIGAPPAEVTVTHPAGWGATRRRILAEAAGAAADPRGSRRRGGLGTPRMVPEPVAATTYFVTAPRWRSARARPAPGSIRVKISG